MRVAKSVVREVKRVRIRSPMIGGRPTTAPRWPVEGRVGLGQPVNLRSVHEQVSELVVNQVGEPFVGLPTHPPVALDGVVGILRQGPGQKLGRGRVPTGRDAAQNEQGYDKRLRTHRFIP